MDLSSPRRKTHNLGFTLRRLHYRWHPWYGRDLLTRKAGGANASTAYFCKLPETGPELSLLELPQWMFDEAACAAMRLELSPLVDSATLRQLQATIVTVRACLSRSGVTTRAIPTSESGRHT